MDYSQQHLTFWEHVHQFRAMVNGIVDNVAAQLNDSYRFGIDFDGAEHSSKDHNENQQNDHYDGRCRIDGVSQCDANVFVSFAIQFDDAGHAERQQSGMPWHDPILEDFPDFRQFGGRIVFDSEYFDGVVNNVDEDGYKW